MRSYNWTAGVAAAAAPPIKGATFSQVLVILPISGRHVMQLVLPQGEVIGQASQGVTQGQDSDVTEALKMNS